MVIDNASTDASARIVRECWAMMGRRRSASLMNRGSV